MYLKRIFNSYKVLYIAFVSDYAFCEDTFFSFVNHFLSCFCVATLDGCFPFFDKSFKVVFDKKEKPPAKANGS